MAEGKTLADWYYATIEGSSYGYPAGRDPGGGPEQFLEAVHAAKRPDTREFFKTLAADARFEATDWQALRGWLTLANQDLPEPLVTTGAIYHNAPNRNQPDQAATLAAWRNQLRRQYGVPEKPAAVSPTPP
jgi:hypothetical protein